MATIEQNQKVFNDWTGTGDEWSTKWGGSESEWYFTILPRIHSFVPAETILEIAPGHGRWTRFLTGLCKKLIVVDLSENCIDTCKKIFKEYSNITYHVNDGKSLNMIPEESVDLVFSFDSLIHAEEDVIEAYLGQLAKKLKRNGVGFIQHSNAGNYKTYFSFVQKMPDIMKRVLLKLKIIESDHWRAPSMTAAKFEKYAQKAGLKCLSQELINFENSTKLIDCISVFTRRDSDIAKQNQVLKNKYFMKNAELIKKVSSLYTASPFKKYT